MTEWRLILGDGGSDSLESDGARNMAVDQVLFDGVKQGARPVLRLYRWAPACLSVGRNQPARGRYDTQHAAVTWRASTGGATDAERGAVRGAAGAAGADTPIVPGRHVVRRPTGGLAVFHDQELTYAIACPVGAIGSPRATYVRVHRALAAALAVLGAETALTARAAAHTPSPADPRGVCFHASAEGEIVAPAGKVVGSAQRCEARSILQHGSILIDGTQARAAAQAAAAQATAASDRAANPAAAQDRAGNPTAALARPAAGIVRAGTEATIAALLGRTPEDAELVDAVTAAFGTSLGIRLAPAALSAEEVGGLEAAEAHYRSAAWTWRV